LAKKKLHWAKVARLSIDFRSLGPAKRMSAIVVLQDVWTAGSLASSQHRDLHGCSKL